MTENNTKEKTTSISIDYKKVVGVICGLLSAFTRATEADKGIQRLQKVSKAIQNTEANLQKLKEEKASIEKGLAQKVVEFTQVLPTEEHGVFHTQLFKNEKVHPLRTTEELVSQRIGPEDSNRRCYIRYVDRKGLGPKITAGIFVDFSVIDLDPHKNFEENFPGNINAVKNTSIEMLIPPGKESGQYVVAILYTISNGENSSDMSWEKGGRSLASNIYQRLYDEASEKGYNLIISTLSPVRTPQNDGISKWLYEQKDFRHLVSKQENGEYVASNKLLDLIQTPEGQDVMRQQVIRYLASYRNSEGYPDQVMNFHLGNGAYVGDINFNQDNPKDWLMMNYVYHPDSNVVTSNQTLYSHRNADGSYLRPMSAHLYNFAQEHCPEYASSFSLISNNPLQAKQEITHQIR
ncbi:MAG: malonyl-CoA decarboxylase domain-containing protein [Bdellovibrionales bacterium]